MVFIAHSMGGLILKKILNIAKLNGDQVSKPT